MQHVKGDIAYQSNVAMLHIKAMQQNKSNVAYQSNVAM
jgi:hypothetical protein